MLDPIEYRKIKIKALDHSFLAIELAIITINRGPPNATANIALDGFDMALDSVGRVAESRACVATIPIAIHE